MRGSAVTDIPFKRGDTFLYNAALTDDNGPVDITAVDIRCQIRDKDVLISEAVIVKALPNSAGIFSVRVDDTTLWPTKVLSADVQYTINGQIISTETFGISVVKDITRD